MSFQLNITCSDLNWTVTHPFIPDNSMYSQLAFGQYDIEYKMYTSSEQLQMAYGSYIYWGINLEDLNRGTNQWFTSIKPLKCFGFYIASFRNMISTSKCMKYLTILCNMGIFLSVAHRFYVLQLYLSFLEPILFWNQQSPMIADTECLEAVGQHSMDNSGIHNMGGVIVLKFLRTIRLSL